MAAGQPLAHRRLRARGFRLRLRSVVDRASQCRPPLIDAVAEACKLRRVCLHGSLPDAARASFTAECSELHAENSCRGNRRRRGLHRCRRQGEVLDPDAGLIGASPVGMPLDELLIRDRRIACDGSLPVRFLLSGRQAWRGPAARNPLRVALENSP